MKKEQSNLKLKRACTFFMVPFYFEGEWEEIHQHISRWTPQESELYEEDILYPYIMELFKKEGKVQQKAGMQTGDKSQTNRLKIYQLRTDDKGSASDFFFDRILGKKNVAILDESPSGAKTPYPIPFIFLNDGNNAPHLFVSTSAKIGVMTLCADLGEGRVMQDLQMFNYFLHKRNEIKQVVVGKKILPDKKEKEIKDRRTENYRVVCPSPETNRSPSDAEVLGAVAPFLTKDGYKQLLNEKDKEKNEYINWDLNNFIGFLLNTLKWNSQIQYFSKERLHVYTFCSVDNDELKGCSITSDDLVSEAIRLSRVVNNKYLLPLDELKQTGAVLQTYQNIYFSSAIEGTSMVCVAEDVNRAFVIDLQDKFNRQYLLIYLLVLLQRYTLLSIDRKLTAYDVKNDNSDSELWDMIDLICKIKVNCYYTDVSVYTHHSQFYQHCCRSLHIPETFKEIDEKVELLRMITARQTQQLMSEQKALQQEEAKKQETERERQKQRDEEIKRQNEELRAQEAKERDAAEKRSRILNWVVAILTIAQVIQASYEIICHKNDRPMWYSLCVGAIGVILLVWLMWKDIVKFIRNK